MKIKDKHCICMEWQTAYLEAIQTSENNKHEVMIAQKRGVRCPFCDKELIEKERKAFVLIQFPAVFVNKPNEPFTPYTSGSFLEYWLSIEELKQMLKDIK